MAERVIITARRDSTTRTQTLSQADAEAEAVRLRAEGWVVTIGPSRAQRESAKSKKERAMIIAAHRSARRARQGADDDARATETDPN